MPEMRFNNKVAVVTGCTSGIGQAVLAGLVKEGATAYMMVRNEEKASHIADELNAVLPGKVAGIVYFYLSELHTIEPAIKKVYDDAGRIDLFVNNAVGAKRGAEDHTVTGTPLEVVKDMVTGVFLQYNECLRVAIPLMISGGGGNIVNISSASTLAAEETRTYYKCSKHAVNALTEHVAVQYGRDNIRCNAVLPGFTVSPAAMRSLPQQFIDGYLSHAPIKRLCTPEDQANAVLFLLSDESSAITGQKLAVDTGWNVGYALYTYTD